MFGCLNNSCNIFLFLCFNIFFIFRVECSNGGLNNRFIEMPCAREVKENYYKIGNNNRGNLVLKGGNEGCQDCRRYCVLNYVLGASAFSLFVSGIAFLSIYFTKPKTKDEIIITNKDVDLFECDNTSLTNCGSNSVLSNLNSILSSSGLDYCFGNRNSTDYLYNFEINNDNNCILKSSSIYVPVSLIDKEDNIQNDNEFYNTENLFSNSNISYLKILNSPIYNKLNVVYNLFDKLTMLKYIDITGFDINNVQFIYRMFSNLNNTVVVGLNGLDIKNVIYIEKLFYNSKIINSNMSMIRFSNLVNVESLFYNSSLDNVDLSGFDFPKCIYISRLFELSKMDNVLISGSKFTITETFTEVFLNSKINNFYFVDIDLNNTRTINGLFKNTRLKNIKLENIKLGSLKYASSLFENAEIDNLELNIGAPELEDISSIFEGTKIKNINITINSNKINNLNRAFMNTTAETVDIYGIKTLNNASTIDLITESNNLKKFSFDSDNDVIENELIDNNFSCEPINNNRMFCFKN